MSTPPWRSREVLGERGGASSAVMSSCSAVPPIRLATAARSSPWAGTSRQTTCAPSRASTSAIAAPIPREAPVTSRDPAVQRPLPVVGRVLRPPSPTRITWPRRRRPSGRRAGSAASTRGSPRRPAHVDELGGRAARAPPWPRERTKPSSARWATPRASPPPRAACRARAGGRSARARGSRAGRSRTARAGRRVRSMPRGVEDQRAERRLVVGGSP